MKKLLILAAVSFIVSCDIDIYKQDGYVEQYVVESYLVAREPFPELLLSTTAPIFDMYRFEERVVNNASVHIYELSGSGARIDHIPYRQSDSPGVYLPVTVDKTVKPGTRYNLEINGLPDADAFISSETYVPHSFEFLEINFDTLSYQSTEQFEVTMTRGFYPGRQNIYIFTTEALDTVQYPLTPIYQFEFADNFGGDSFQLVSSPILHEGNYRVNPDDTITIPLPWIMVAYLGPNRITAYAIDDNIYDFYRSADVQLGGSTQSPGEIENVIYNIDGGIGIFGSMTGVSTNIYVKPVQ
jgi:hypothetical protein